MACGIATFVAVYVALDLALVRRGLVELRQRLIMSVYIKLALQIYPAIELMAGFGASVFLSRLGFDDGMPPFLLTYCTTVLVALQLSMVVGVILLIWTGAVRLRRKY